MPPEGEGCYREWLDRARWMAADYAEDPGDEERAVACRPRRGQAGMPVLRAEGFCAARARCGAELRSV